MKGLIAPLRAIIDPYLKEQGFRREGRDWRRNKGELVQYFVYSNQNKWGVLFIDPYMGYFSPAFYDKCGVSVAPGSSQCQMSLALSKLCGRSLADHNWELETVEEAEAAGKEMLQAYIEHNEAFWNLVSTADELVDFIEKQPRYYTYVGKTRKAWEIAVWRDQIDRDKVPFSADWQEKR